MSWYKQSMPTVKDVEQYITQICGEIKAISGVTNVYLHGSYPKHISNPNYVVKDVDIIASTAFDSGDLYAIDNGKYSALKMHPADLEDEGFNPKAVAFTKKFLSYSKYNVDHWVATADSKLLHWGEIPDSQEEWQELHKNAEKEAERCSGFKRSALSKVKEDDRQLWKKAYEHYVSQFTSDKSIGWYPSENILDEILIRAKKV